MLSLLTPREKQCTKCTKIKLFKEFPLYNGKFGSRCYECLCISSQEYHNTFNGFFTKLLTDARKSASRRLANGRVEAGMFNITRENLLTIWNKQNGKCYYSDIQMTPQQCSDWMCSLERLDNNKGYVIDNIVLVCFEFNNFTKWTANKIQQMIFLVYEHHDDSLLLQEINNALNRVNPHRKREKTIKNDIGEYKCKKCNIFKSETEFTKCIRNGCKDCIKIRDKKYRSTINGHLRNLLDHTKESTKRRNNNSNRSGDNTFDMIYEDLVTLLRNQHGRCAYSGIKLNYGSGLEKDWVASLERINPLRGYTRDNICLICAEFNGTDYTAIAKYSNGGSGAWSKEKFNLFLSTVLSNTNSNELIKYGELSISLDMWKSINNPLYIQKFPTTNFQLEIIDVVSIEQSDFQS